LMVAFQADAEAEVKKSLVWIKLDRFLQIT
jgi:hypothetical protein